MKEIIKGRNVFVGGEVLSRADDFDGLEEYLQRDMDADAEMKGYAMRSARVREQNIRNSTIEVNYPDSQSDEVEKEPSVQSGIYVPREVMDLMIDAAHKEGELRDKGVTPSRIASIVGKTLMPSMIRLQLNSIDASRAFGSSQLDDDDIVVAFNPRQARIDKMIDGGMSLYEAEMRA